MDSNGVHMIKISLLGPTNLNKFSKIMNKPIFDIEKIGEKIGKVIAKNKCELIVVFNYSGMLKIVGNSYKKEGGKLEMMYTENDYDWETKCYMKHLKEADVKTKKRSWHDMLLSLVKDSDLVVCAGLSSGVFSELAYMKWNHQENKGNTKALVGIKELLRENKFPDEISFDIKDITIVDSIKNFEGIIKKFAR